MLASIYNQKTLAVVGAGPKGIAVALKARVLKEFGLPVPRVILVERHGIAAHWTGEAGFTNGAMKLGTSPEKDAVYPMETATGLRSLDEQIHKRLLEFSWMAYLVDSKKYSSWIDRGRPPACHQMWAQYLKWISKKFDPELEIIAAELVGVKRIFNHLDVAQWKLSLKMSGREAKSTTLVVDELMFTGPGLMRTDFELSLDTFQSSGIYHLENIWALLKSRSFVPKARIALVGAGENAASVLMELGSQFPGVTIEVISSKGFISTRSENFYENQFYSDPEASEWKNLHYQDRRDFIERTDLGVFSVQAMQLLNGQKHHKIIPGRVKRLSRRESSDFEMHLEYGEKKFTKIYDQVILATGFDQSKLLKKLLSEESLEYLRKKIASEILDANLALRIDEDLSVEGMLPKLYLPMLAGIKQGPGFANLSCLGRLSDRVLLHSYLSKQKIQEESFLQRMAL